jgi:8-oxo-dGTP pyrophosphatase MutT (NUDIX family)
VGYVGSYLWSIRQMVGSMLVLAPGAQVLLVNDRGEGYFQRRRDRDLWEIPAGGCELGSTFASTAVAEVREETGLIIDPTDLTAFACISDPAIHVIEYPGGDRTHCFSLCFVARKWTGEVASDNDEVMESGFFPLDAPPTPLHPPTVLALELYARFLKTGAFQAR